jgi:hypothetical protein
LRGVFISVIERSSSDGVSVVIRQSFHLIASRRIMSMLDLLLRYIDPIAHRQKQEERRRKREALPPDVDDDFVESVLPPPSADRRAATHECRVCGLTAESEERFCPTCLAETMGPRRRTGAP